jgi:glutathione S-transferase
MILIGQYDSSFVRRVGIALTLYGLPFEHRPWSVFGDADKIRPLNPLIRVPVLILDDGEALIESHAILDYVDCLVPEEKRLFPVRQPERRHALKIASLATGLADKAVTLFYEVRLHQQVSDEYVARSRSQITGALGVLEAERAGRRRVYWFGDDFGHADIAVACALRHFNEAHPGMVSMTAYPALDAHCRKLEALPVFLKISQPFVAPA